MKIQETLLPLPRVLLFDFRNAYTLHNAAIFLETTLFIYLSFISGDLLLRLMRCAPLTPMRRTGYAVLLGYGAFGMVGLILSFFGVLNAWPLRIFAAISMLVSGKTITSHFSSILTLLRSPKIFALRLWGMLRDSFFLKAVLLFWLAANFFLVFVPVTSYDALAYHLPIVAELIKSEKFTSMPHLAPYSFMPLFTEVFYAVPMLIFGNLPPLMSQFPADMQFRDRIYVYNTAAPFIFQLLQYSALLLFLMLIYDFLNKRLRHPFLKIVALLLVLSISDVQREVMHSGYVDMFVYLFGIAGLLLVMENIERGAINRPELNLSAIFIGISLGMKYLALFFLGFAGLFLLAGLMRSGQNLREFGRYWLQFLLIAGAIAGFWYVKNAVLFGDPVYPMLSVPEFQRNVSEFVLERKALNFFLFPFLRFGQWFLNPDETSSRLIVFGYFGAFYILPALFVFLRQKIGAVEIMLFSFIQLYMSMLFFLSHHIRYLLPPIMLLPVFITLLTDAGYDYIRRALGGRSRAVLIRASTTVLALVFLLMFIGNVHYFNIRFNYVTGIYSQDEYIGEIGWQ